MMDAKPKLRIVQVITPHRFAGAERACAHLSAALRDRGHNVLVVMPPRLPEFREYLAELAVPVEQAQICGKLNPSATARLAAIVRDFGADVIHSHLSTAALRACAAGRRTGVPTVAHVHAMNRAGWYRRADLVIACSRGVADHLRRQGLRRPIEVVYNGLLLAEFQTLRPAGEVRQELGLPRDAPIIGVVASLTRRKGHRYLLEALAALRDRWPNLLCIILGSGPLRARLCRLAERLGVSHACHFLGFRQDRLEIMQLLDLLVLPSVAIEGFGLVILEAAALGVPAVASDMPGIDEAVVNGQTGLLVPPGDSAALANAIDTLLRDDNLRQRMGQAARDRALREFTIERMAAEVENCYLRLLASRTAAAG